ncbi:MAG: M1 family metallopeptidase [Litorimonas sp.]
MKRLLLLAALTIAACSPSMDREPVAETPVVGNPVADASVAVPQASRDAVPHAQLPETVTPSAYRIDFVIDPEADGMTGTVEIDATVNADTDGFWIHAKEMEVSDASIEMDGATLPLVFDPVPLDDAPSGLAWLAAPQGLSAGEGTIRLVFSTPYNLNLNSAYKVVRGNDAYIVTQMEPIGAREAFPGLDEPKYKQPFTISITAPQGQTVVSNTPLVSETPVEGGMVRHQFAQTRPLPTYLVAFAVGPYDVVEFADIPPNAVRDRPIKLRGIAARGEGPRLQYALENTDGLLSALEGYFGREYPYEKLDLLAAPEYAFGAMENPGLIVYREYLLLLDEDAPLAQKRSYARVHSHELAHQWFGNLVTPVWWEDIWLNEAFATWMGNKGLTLWRPDGDFDNVTLKASLDAMNIDSLSTTRRVREPLTRSENVMDQFDGITYRKGGGVLDMFEAYLGEEAFQRGVRLHMERYADGVATADDFFQSIADGSGDPDVVDAMKSFVDQKGLPLVSVGKVICDETQTAVQLSQSRYAPLGSKIEQGQSWQIPVCVKLGSDPRHSCMMLKKPETKRLQLLLSDTESCPAFIMPNAGAAGYYRFTLDPSGWEALLSNLGELTTKEALSAQDSLVAAFRSGEVEAETFLSGMRAFAAHPDHHVASGSTRLLGFIHDEFPQLRAGLARHVRSTYGQRYRAIRGEDTVEGALLAPQLGALLATVGRDMEARNYLLRQGTLALGLGVLEQDEPKRTRVPSNMLASAYAEVMRRTPGAGFEPLLDLAANGSPLQKGAALQALTRTPDPDQAQRLLDLALSEDSPLTGRQSGTIIAGLLANEAHSDRTWEWYRANFDRYMVRKVPDVRRGRAPNTAGGFCSLEKRDEVREFYQSRAALIPGYERSLAQSLERIELCAALKAEQGPSLTAALGG